MLFMSMQVYTWMTRPLDNLSLNDVTDLDDFNYAYVFKYEATRQFKEWAVRACMAQQAP
jgi:hypothetical protein